MAKISRPILYMALLGAVVGTYLFLSEPDAPAKKGSKKPLKGNVKVGEGITVEDLNAKFDRYAGKGKDGFFPRVIPAKSALGEAAKRGGLDSWNLTGVSIVNGAKSATLENTQTKELQFIKAGDRWNGLKVTLVASDYILFRNDKNQETRLTFIDPDVDKARLGVVSTTAGVSTAPVLIASPNSPNIARATATNPQTTQGRGTTQP